MKAIDWLNVARCSAARLNELRQKGLPPKGEQDTLRMACQLAATKNLNKVKQQLDPKYGTQKP